MTTFTPPPQHLPVVSDRAGVLSRRSCRTWSTLLAFLIWALLVSPTAFAAPISASGAPGSTQTRIDTSWLPETPVNWPLVVEKDTAPQQTITNGVTLSTTLFKTVGGPEQASLLNVDLTNPNVRLGTVQADGHLFSSDESISSMANRTGAVAGINADFFEIYGSGAPLGMEISNGQLLQSPDNNTVVLGVTPSGKITIGPETFSGTVTDGTASYALNSVNRYEDINQGHLALFTPVLGSQITINNDALALLHPVEGTQDTYVVQSVQAQASTLPVLAGQEALVGNASAAAWLNSNVHPGDQLTISEQISPDSNLVQAVGGAAQVVKDGAVYNDPNALAPGETNVRNPLTGIGLSKDGKNLMMVVFDGHESGPSQSRGLTRPQMAGYLLSHGAYQGVVFDSGGSSEMVARLPGQHQVSVINSPSDGHERPVTNGLFVYSTEQEPGPATSVVINNGSALTMLAGTTIPLSAYALDAEGNPAADAVNVKVIPPQLASLGDGMISAGARAGHGILSASAGEVSTAEPLDIIDHLASLTVSPGTPDLQNGQTQQFNVAATGPDGSAITLPAGQVRWSVNSSSLGTIDNNGLFTAASDGTALGTVTATAGGLQASASVAVGETQVIIDDLTDVQNWGVTNLYISSYPRPSLPPGVHTTSDGSLAFSSDIKRLPGDKGSMDLHYTFPQGQHVYDLNAYTNNLNTYQVPLLNGDEQPSALGLWVKGNSSLAGGSGGPLALGQLTFTMGFFGADNATVKFYPTALNFAGWQFVAAVLPQGVSYPLRVNYIGVVIINPATNMDGDVYFSDLQALYSPRPPAPYHYTPVPQNPSWLQYEENPASFSQNGATIASLDDAHVRTDDPNSTGSVSLELAGQQFKQLPPQAQPGELQTQGDMSDSGATANLHYLKSLLDSFGVPYYEAVGNHEITQGANPENANFTSVFGPTHYSYIAGPANFIVTDSSHIGILASDPYQVPDETQYQWLVAQLSMNTSRVVFITTHVPAYDPHIVKDSQFADRYEAQMYELLAERYQQTHPTVHVVLLFGHARGFAENLLDQYGNDSPSGLPNFVVADVGVPAYAPADQGGFYNYVLFHVQPDGNVQFAVMPLLKTITINAPQTTLTRDQQLQLTALGTAPNGDDLPPLQLPVSDPASHYWTSSDPAIASVDPMSGKVIAHHTGSVTISCTSDLISASITLTVQ